MRSDRWSSATIALAIAWTAGCGGNQSGGLGPPQDDGASVAIVSPADGSASVQVSMPDSIQIVIDARNNQGIVTPTDSLDGIWIGNNTKFSHPISVGSHTLKACVQNSLGMWKCSTSTFTLNPAPPIVVQVVCDHRLGLTSADNIRAYAKRGAIKDSADFVGCRAEIPPRLRLLPDTGRTDIWFDAKDPGARTHSPSIAYVTHDSLSMVQKFVPGPIQPVIPRGVGVGSSIAVDFGEIFTPGPDGFSFFFRTRQRDGSYFYTNGTWLQSPIPVAVRREDSLPVSAGDLAIFPQYLQESADEWGLTFTFVGQAPNGTDPISGMMVFTITETSHSSHGAPQTNGFTGDVISGMATISSADLHITPRVVIKHEVGHMLNMGHPEWLEPKGLMSTFQMSTSDPKFGHVQPLENGLFWLQSTMREVQKESGAQYGLAYAHEGWRRLVLNLPLSELVISP